MRDSSSARIKAVILCGGQGTRIRDVSEAVPKPMLPIGGKPILWHIMKLYAYHGIKDFVLCLGYKGWSIKEFFLNYRAVTADLTVELGKTDGVTIHGSSPEEGWRITLAETGETAQTGARIWNARRYLENTERFCMTYGDGVADLNVTKLLREHAQSDCVGMLSGVRPAGRFGEIDCEGGRVRHFHEKPNTTGGTINGGFMVFRTAEALRYFRPGDDLNLEQEVLPKLVQDQQLAVYQHEGFWQCMDTLREFNLLNDLWARGQAPWKVW